MTWHSAVFSGRNFNRFPVIGTARAARTILFVPLVRLGQAKRIALRHHVLEAVGLLCYRASFAHPAVIFAQRSGSTLYREDERLDTPNAP